MDTREAMHAHVTWYADLADRLRKGESVDPANVDRDDVCEMGKWIYGEGLKYEALPEYQAYKAIHAKYHHCAADSVKMASTGNVVGAVERLEGEGDCMEMSDELLEKHHDLVKRIKKEEG